LASHVESKVVAFQKFLTEQNNLLAIQVVANQTVVQAQPFIQTIKYRNLVIDLGNGVKTNAQLTLPALGDGPCPGVLLIPGSGAEDMNETVAKNAKPFWQISQYLIV
jgi:hypothetical protein